MLYSILFSFPNFEEYCENLRTLCANHILREINGASHSEYLLSFEVLLQNIASYKTYLGKCRGLRRTFQTPPSKNIHKGGIVFLASGVVG